MKFAMAIFSRKGSAETLEMIITEAKSRDEAYASYLAKRPKNANPVVYKVIEQVEANEPKKG